MIYRKKVALACLISIFALSGCASSPDSKPQTDQKTDQKTDGASTKPPETKAGQTKRLGAPLWNMESVGPVNAPLTAISLQIAAHGKFSIFGWAVDPEAKAPA